LDYAEQIDDFSRLNELDLNRIIDEKYWSDFKEEKQAEFLACEAVPWQAIKTIGVINSDVAGRVEGILRGCSHQPEVKVKPSWYY
jgi:hypothetical protein